MEILSRILLHSLDGFVFGWLYALIAFGLSLIFGILLIINVAHGALYMLGAVFGWFFVQGITGDTGNFWLGLLLAPLVVGALAILTEMTILRPIEHQPIMTILSTFGLMLIFENLVLGWVGGQAIIVEAGITGRFPLLIYQYPYYRIFVMVVSISVSIGLWAFLQKTKYGLWVRAVRQNKDLALADGIPVRRVNTFAFGLGGVLAGLSGALAAPIVSVSYQMGLNILIVAFIVVIVGGLGNLLGAVVAGLIFGEVESMSALIVNPTWARVIALLFVTAFLFFRPNGLLSRTR